MTEMIGRVARAIALAAGSEFDRLPTGHAPGFGLRRMYEAMARAAIEAMREPTDEMGIDSDGLDRRKWDCHMCGGPMENWTRMINAALKK